VKPGDLVEVSHRRRERHGYGIVTEVRSRYLDDDRSEELLVTVHHPKTGKTTKWSSHWVEVLSESKAR